MRLSRDGEILMGWLLDFLEVYASGFLMKLAMTVLLRPVSFAMTRRENFILSHFKILNLMLEVVVNMSKAMSTLTHSKIFVQ